MNIDDDDSFEFIELPEKALKESWRKCPLPISFEEFSRRLKQQQKRKINVWWVVKTGYSVSMKAAWLWRTYTHISNRQIPSLLFNNMFLLT